MKYVVVYGSKLGLAIGSLDKFNTQEEAEIELEKIIRDNDKDWKLHWIQKEYIYDTHD